MESIWLCLCFAGVIKQLVNSFNSELMQTAETVLFNPLMLVKQPKDQSEGKHVFCV